MRIEKVSNGYVVEVASNSEVYMTLDEVLGRLLQHFEGRTKSFGGDMYGKVIIIRDKPKAKP